MTAPTQQPDSRGATRAQTTPDPANASTGELIGQLTEQLGRLVRDEARLAQAEVTQKAKKLGVGAGLFGGAGLFAFFGLAALITTTILALALVLPPWLAALIVAAALFVVAGVAALAGRSSVQKAPEPPQERVASVKADVAAVKPHSQEDPR